MGRYRNYSDDDKAQALAFLAANRGNYKATSRQTGIPWQTIQHWDKGDGMTDVPAEVESEKKGSLADALEEKVWLIVGLGFNEQKIKDAYLSNVTTSLGTLIDKVRLLREQPTQIHGDDGSEKRIIIDYRGNERRPAPDALPPVPPSDAVETD